MLRKLLMIFAALVALGGAAKSYQLLRPAPVYASTGAAPGWVISHKTAGLEFAENSVEGFRASLEMNVDAIEIDVHVVKGGDVVLHHDPVLSSYNCFDKQSTDKVILAQSTAEELAGWECRNHKVGIDYRIVTLDDFLQMYVQTDMSKTLLIEIKVWDELIENNPIHVDLDVSEMHYDDVFVAEQVYEVLRGYPQVEKVQFNTFGRDLLLILKDMKAPEEPFEFGLLYKGHYAPWRMGLLALVLRKECYDSCWAPDYAEARQWLRDNDISIFIPNHVQLDNLLFARSFRKHILEDRDGLTIYPWTLNEPKDWAAYQTIPFDGILTDKPQGFRKWLAAAQ